MPFVSPESTERYQKLRWCPPLIGCDGHKKGLKGIEDMVCTTIGGKMIGEIGAATYSIEEAAKLLGIGRKACYEAARTGQVPTVRIGKRLLVPKAALAKLLQGAVARGAS